VLIFFRGDLRLSEDTSGSDLRSEKYCLSVSEAKRL
jgi:hypothetical protein